VETTIENKIRLSVFEDEVRAILDESSELLKDTMRIDIIQQTERVMNMSVQEIIRYYGIDRIGEDLYLEYMMDKTKGVTSLNIMKNKKMVDKLEALFATPFDGADRNYDLNKTIEILYEIQTAYDLNQEILIIDNNIWGECHDIILEAVGDDKSKDSKYIWLEDVSEKVGKWVYVSREHFDKMYAREIDYTSHSILELFTHVGAIAQHLQAEGKIEDFNIEDITNITKKFLIDFFIFQDIKLLVDKDTHYYGVGVYLHEYLEDFYYDKILKTYKK
jgi:hypothetical protein